MIGTPTSQYGTHSGQHSRTGRTYYTPQQMGPASPSPPSSSSPQPKHNETYTRQPSAHSPSSHQQNVGEGTPSPDQETIEYAARVMDRLMNRDLQFPSLYKSLTQFADPNTVVPGNRPVSGFMEYDYPSFLQRHVIPENQFTMIHNTPIPAELNEMLNQADVQFCHMGLFPDIHRAWMTIDNDLYLWDFRDGTDLSFFDGLKEPIITMSLVPAKPKIFQNSIKHLLCITTASEITIHGFVLTDPVLSGSGPVIELVPQPIFVVPTEGVSFNVISGTKGGRIFLGGKDGSIHEVNYKSEKGWMSDRCWKTNHSRSYLSSLFKFISYSSPTDPIVQIVSDDIKNLLYTRSTSGCLQVFDLGGDGTKFSRVSCCPFERIVNEVVALSKKTLEGNAIKRILSIAPICTGEINLVAVLDNGIRLYFSLYDGSNNSNLPIGHLYLVHVRMPPGYCTAASIPKPTIGHTAFLANGLFALAARTAQDNDSFWLINPFIYPTNCLSEMFSIQKLSGQTLDIKMMPQSLDAHGNAGLDYLPDIITQHLNWHREIVVLTSNGTCVFRAQKPYEVLKNLLIECGNVEGLRSHFESIVQKEQPLSNAILLSVHPSTGSEPSIFELAVKSFFLYGANEYSGRLFGDSRINSPFENTMDFNPNLVSTPRQEGGAQSPYGNIGTESGYTSSTGQNSQQRQQQQQQPSSSPMQSPGGEHSVFSPRHDALYLVVGRILFHFWNRPLVNTGNSGEGSPSIITPNIQGQEVAQAITFLQNIATFISNNPSLYTSRINISAPMINLNTVDGRQLYNQENEKSSIIALRSFLNMALEVLNMWKILCDHQFHIVLHGVDNQLENSTMRDLVISGHTTVSVIINALISKYLGDNAAVDAISLRLREVCPTLFKSEDAIGSKVAEILAKVKTTTDKQEKELLLKESLMLSEKICGHGRVNVRNLCKQYSDLGFAVGAVRLCISAAKTADPEKLALITIKTTSTSSDPVGLQAFQTRSDIYRIVFDMLDNYVQLASTSQSPLLRGTDRLTPQNAQLGAEETIHAILTSDDEMFHTSLYNWLLERKQFDRLLAIKHPYLDSFLQRAADAVVSGKWTGTGMSANDTRVLDLLWRHHEMNQNHSAAANILSRLAETTTTGLNLQQRLEYMARAIICSKSCSRRGDLLETLEDKVEVAQIQKNIFDSINSRMENLISTRAGDEDISGELKAFQDAANKLNSQLLSITQLYAEFAHPLKLNDAKLEIFYSAGHADKPTIEAVWAEIIEDELTANASKTTESQMEIIRKKIVMLGRKYKTSPSFFPLEYLIEHLEMMKPQDTENVTWVFKTMLEVGINFSDVLFVYERLWRKCQSKGSGDVEIAKVITFMVDSLTKQELDIRSAFFNRPDMLEKCKDFISIMIVEYSSRFDPSSTEMNQILNHVRDRLDRVSTMMK